MSGYLFTIPQRYRREPHPLGVGADDLIRVEAENEIGARLIMNRHLGPGTWCSVLVEDDPESEALIREYYPGRVVDFDPGDRLYRSILDAEIEDIARAWDPAERLSVHVNRWLAEHGFRWDSDRSDEDNQDEFFELLDKVIEVVRRGRV